MDSISCRRWSSWASETPRRAASRSTNRLAVTRSHSHSATASGDSSFATALIKQPTDGVALRRKDRRKPKSGPAVQEQELLSALHK